MRWYEDMFDEEDPVRSKDYIESEASRSQIDFVIEKTGIRPGDRVLDLCCGQGRHLIDLVRRGYDAVGVDLSDYMLSKCREIAEIQGIKAILFKLDMRDIKFSAEFDLVINMFTSFGYLESECDDQKVLDGVSRALKPGGKFFIDALNRDWLVRTLKPRSWEENEKSDYGLLETWFDAVTGRIEAREIRIFADGSRKEIRHSVRLYTYNEFDRMLKTAGLNVISAWGDFDGSVFSTESKRMILVAEKQHSAAQRP